MLILWLLAVMLFSSSAQDSEAGDHVPFNLVPATPNLRPTAGTPSTILGSPPWNGRAGIGGQKRRLLLSASGVWCRPEPKGYLVH